MLWFGLLGRPAVTVVTVAVASTSVVATAGRTVVWQYCNNVVKLVALFC